MTRKLIIYGLCDFLKPIEREALTVAMGGSVATFLKPTDCAWCGLLYKNEDLASRPGDLAAGIERQADTETNTLPGVPPPVGPLVQPGQTHCQCLNRYYVFGSDAPAAMIGIDRALKAVRYAERDSILKYVLAHSRAVDILRNCRRLNPNRRIPAGEASTTGPGQEDLVFLPLWEYYQSEWEKVHRRLCYVERSEAFRARAVEHLGWTYYDLFVAPVFRFAERLREQRQQAVGEDGQQQATEVAGLKLRTPSGRKRLMGSVRFRPRDRQHRLTILAKCFAAHHSDELLAWLEPGLDFVTLWTRSDRLLELLVATERFVLGGAGQIQAVVHMLNRLQRNWAQSLFARSDTRFDDLEVCESLWAVTTKLTSQDDVEAGLQHAVVQAELLDHPMWRWNEELQPVTPTAKESEEEPDDEPARPRRKRFRTQEHMARESREARRQAMDILDTLSRMLDRTEAS